MRTPPALTLTLSAGPTPSSHALHIIVTELTAAGYHVRAQLLNASAAAPQVNPSPSPSPSPDPNPWP